MKKLIIFLLLSSCSDMKLVVEHEANAREFMVQLDERNKYDLDDPRFLPDSTPPPVKSQTP